MEQILNAEALAEHIPTRVPSTPVSSPKPTRRVQKDPHPYLSSLRPRVRSLF